LDQIGGGRGNSAWVTLIRKTKVSPVGEVIIENQCQRKKRKTSANEMDGLTRALAVELTRRERVSVTFPETLTRRGRIGKAAANICYKRKKVAGRPLKGEKVAVIKKEPSLNPVRSSPQI